MFFVTSQCTCLISPQEIPAPRSRVGFKPARRCYALRGRGGICRMSSNACCIATSSEFPLVTLHNDAQSLEPVRHRDGANVPRERADTAKLRVAEPGASGRAEGLARDPGYL